MATSNIETFLIAPDLEIKQAMKFMSKHGRKEVFLADAGHKLMGALSDGDIRKWILRGGSLNKPVLKICNRTPVFVREGHSVEEVKEKMLSLRIESIPVLDMQGFVIGVLAWDDVFAITDSRHACEPLDVDVVVMAGGRGARLDPFTRILPKPLIPIGNKTIIEIIMDRFGEHGIRKFHVTVNHQAKLIKYYFEDIKDRYKVHFVEEKTPLGTAGSLRLLPAGISNPFIVTNCDILIESDYAEIVRFHKDNRHAVTLVVSYRHFVIPYGVCSIKQGGELKAIKEKPEFDFFVSTGMYIMNKSVLKFIPKGHAMDANKLVEKVKASGGKVGVFPINEKSWVDVGQWKEYHEAIEKLKGEVG